METFHHFLQGLFVGRLSRKEYYIGLLVVTIAGILYLPVFVFLLFIYGSRFEPEPLFLVTYSPFIVLALIFISLGARRLHDIGWSGWWMLIAGAPVVNLILFIGTLFIAGKSAGDTYGKTPDGSRGINAVLWNYPAANTDDGERGLAYVNIGLTIVALLVVVYSPDTQPEQVISDDTASPLQLTLNDLHNVPEHGTPVEPQPLIINGGEVFPGEWYALELSDGSWRVVKVLKIDNSSVFFAAYYDLFDELPVWSDVFKLEKGYEHDMLPVAIFAGSKPHYLTAGAVTDDERKAFQLWQLKRGM